MNQAFDEDVQTAFREAKVDYVKGAPSATNIHQAADISSNFRSVKSGLRTVTKNRVEYRNTTLEANLRQALVQLKAAFPNVTIPALKANKFVNGVQRVAYVMKQGYYKAGEATKGFTDCGQHITFTEPGQPTVDYKKIMSKTWGILTDAEMAHMEAMRPQVVAEYQRTGRVTDAFLDNLGIARTTLAVDRTDLVLTR